MEAVNPAFSEIYADYLKNEAERTNDFTSSKPISMKFSRVMSDGAKAISIYKNNYKSFTSEQKKIYQANLYGFYVLIINNEYANARVERLERAKQLQPDLIPELEKEEVELKKLASQIVTIIYSLAKTNRPSENN